MNSKKSIASPLLLFFCLVCGLPGIAKGIPPEFLPNFRETVWLQTGRDFFVPGETVEFSAFVLEKDTYHLSELSRFLRVELVNQKGEVLSRRNLERNVNGFSGKIILDPSLTSGWYFIRAYTNWMRNFPVAEFTLHRIKVINPVQNPEILAPSNELNPDKPVPDGIRMSVHKDGRSVNVEVTGLDAGITRDIQLLVHRTYSWYWFRSESLRGSTARFEVPADSLPPGIIQFSLLDNCRSVLARKLWSDNNPNINNVRVEMSSDTLGLRTSREIRFNVDQLDFSTGTPPLVAFISMNSLLNRTDSSLPGLPGWSASSDIPADSAEFASWLENHSYPDACALGFFPRGATFPADPASLNQPPLSQPGFVHFPETRYGVLSGVVVDSMTKKGVPSVGIGINIMNNNTFLSTSTDSSGVFSFALREGNGSLDYILSFLYDPDTSWMIRPSGTWDERPFVPDPVPFNVTPAELELSRKLNTNLQVNQVFFDTLQVRTPSTTYHQKAEMFFYPPERTILTDRYIELASVQEVIYEVVPDVRVIRRAGKAFITVSDFKPYSQGFKTLVLLDGIPLADQHELLDLPPNRVKMIQVKNKLFIHGDYLFSGIVNLVSRNEDFAGLKLPAQSMTGSFVLPMHDDHKNISGKTPGSPFLPVLDPVLFSGDLNPQAKRALQFQTGDLPGNYRIRIFGFDRSGSWCYGYRDFVVDPPIL
jgi:hypothetical protein